MLTLSSTLQTLLLEAPLPLVGVLLAGAAGLWWHGRRIGAPKVRQTAWGCAAAAAAVALLAYCVQTPSEVVSAATRRLVNLAVHPMKQADFAALLDDNAAALDADGGVRVQGRDEVANLLARLVQLYSVQQHFTRIEDIMVSSPRHMRVNIVIRTICNNDFGANFGKTQWQITWRQQGDGQWRVATAQWLTIDGQRPSHGLPW